QMLKSWTQAGHIEYLYFDYPKPDRFPFGKKPLYDILQRKFKSHSLLFNWNTAGSAVLVHGDHFSTITVKQTGALPITYGADSKTKAEGGADVFSYEDQAYQYFASLRDPCLHRVAQYTLIYQLFRAIATDPSNRSNSSAVASSKPVAPSARAGAQAMMRQRAERFIGLIVDGTAIESATDPKVKSYIKRLGEDLRELFSERPDLINTQSLAAILVSRDSAESTKYFETIQEEYEKAWQRFKREADDYDARIETFNRMVSSRSSNLARLKEIKAGLEADGQK